MTDQIPSQQVQAGQGQQPASVPPGPQGTSGLAIAGLVLGVVAVITSFVPILNNAAFFIAIIGLVLAIVGRSQAKKGSKSGGGAAVAGIVLCIVAIVVTLAVQAACSAALDSISSGGSGTVATGSSSASTSAGGDSKGSSEQADTANMAVGQTIDLDNGLSITVNSVTPGLANFDGSPITGISVTYTNNGTSNASFNVFDWKAEDANGAQRDFTYYSDAADELNSGTLSAGGTVTGNVYFDEPIVKVYYYSSIISSSSNIAWNVV